jgi:RHS repeat-associated protein
VAAELPLSYCPNRVISEVTPQGSVSYAYDAAGRRTSIAVSGQTAFNYTFDNANRLTQISQGSANVSFGYDNDSRRTSLTLPNGVSMNYGYDAASQLTGITYKNGATTIGNLTYAYDLAGRRTGVGGSYARTGTPQAASAATYNVNNQLTNWKGATLVYDANGNLTSDGTNTYTWNARNQLVSISGGVAASFQYDPFGRRVSKTIGGITQYLYDGANPVQEISGTTASANLLTGGVDEYFQRTDLAGTRNFLTDALGSTVALADSTGTLQTQYTFEPFGNTTVAGTATTNTFTYTGRELDPTGLYFYRARYYSPQLQRFLSEDPAGFRGGINKYAYVQNSPVNFRDPFGLVGVQGGVGIDAVSQPEVDSYIAELEASLGGEGGGAAAGGGVAGAAAATVGLIVLDVGLAAYDLYELHKLCVAYGACGPSPNQNPAPKPPMAGRKDAGGGSDDPCKGLRDTLRDHQDRLRDYANDPYGNDDKNFLGQGRDMEVIAGRVRNLLQQIKNFQKLLAACEEKHGQE